MEVAPRSRIADTHGKVLGENLYLTWVINMRRNLITVNKEKSMCKFKLIVIFVLIIISESYGVVGYELYPMDGNTIFPLSDVNVKLSEVNLLMNENGEVDSKFTVENLESKVINFKIAFPLQSACINNCTRPPADFIVKIGGEPIQTSIIELNKKDFLERMRERLLPKIAKQITLSKEKAIVWDIALKPKERLTITCSYRLEWYFEPPQRILILRLTPGILWKGNIDKIHFKFSFPKWLIKDIESDRAEVNIEPESNFTRNNRAIEWEFKNVDLKSRKNKILERIGIYVWYKGSGE